MLTWIVFGAAGLGEALEFFSWRVVLYAVLSLTIIRMLPVFICVTGRGVSVESKLFAGWFGPRGLASVVFLVMALDENLEHIDTITSVVCATVIGSIVLHGLSANPWARAFGARESRRDGSG